MEAMLSPDPFPTSLQPWLFHMAVWPDGVKRFSGILSTLDAQPDVSVVHVRLLEKVRIKNQIEMVYAQDHAPSAHLRSKLRYLNRNGSRGSVGHAFFTVREPCFDRSGSGLFRHTYSRRVDGLKWEIRQAFNPKGDSEAQQHHVLHISDHPVQALDVARKLGVIGGESDGNPFFSLRLGLPAPWHLRELHSATIRQAPPESLLASIWGNGQLSLMPVRETPHFRALDGSFESAEAYQEYIVSHQGTRLRDGYSLERLLTLERQVSLHGGSSMAPILIKVEDGDRSVILDGVHRTAVALSIGLPSIEVAEVG